jgi:hypothetical protein
MLAGDPGVSVLARGARAASFLGGPAAGPVPSSDAVARVLGSQLGEEATAARAICASLPRLFETCGTRARADVVAWLRNRASNARDVGTRCEALLALGRIAGFRSCDPDQAMDNLHVIFGEIRDVPSRRTESEHAWTALAFAARGPEAAHADRALRTQRQRGKVPMLLDAALFAVSGTDDDRRRAVSWAADTGLSEDVRGRAALAAALLGAPPAAGGEAGTSPVSLRDVADAAAISGRRLGLAPWIDRTTLANSWMERSDAAACARAIAECADVSCVPELLRIIRDEHGAPSHGRALVVRALGAMCSASGEPFAVYFEDDIRRDHSPALAELAWFVFREE